MESHDIGQQGILGIDNRTENWKTARFFAPLFRGRNDSLVLRLLGEDDGWLELYWSGMRDFAKKMEDEGKPINPEDLARAYNRLFADLHQRITEFGGFAGLKGNNYRVGTTDQKKVLYSNLLHTEIDIVVGTPRHLFIGEAKHLSGFGYEGSDVLVHQLVRQYVMAKILVELRDPYEEIEVVPFVVGDDVDQLHRTGQVRFMIGQKWLRTENVLCWEEIEKLHP